MAIEARRVDTPLDPRITIGASRRASMALSPSTLMSSRASQRYWGFIRVSGFFEVELEKRKRLASGGAGMSWLQHSPSRTNARAFELARALNRSDENSSKAKRPSNLVSDADLVTSSKRVSVCSGFSYEISNHRRSFRFPGRTSPEFPALANQGFAP
jgi:hypothetical protein